MYAEQILTDTIPAASYKLPTTDVSMSPLENRTTSEKVR
jgi:hypothetical protein